MDLFPHRAEACTATYGTDVGRPFNRPIGQTSNVLISFDAGYNLAVRMYYCSPCTTPLAIAPSASAKRTAQRDGIWQATGTAR